MNVNKFIFSGRLKYIAYHTLSFFINILRSLALVFYNRANIVVFGSQFKDNSLVLDAINASTLNVNIRYYIISDDVRISTITNLCYVKRGTLKHYILCIIASVYVVTHKVRDIFYVKPRGVVLINLWHGVPIKAIGFKSKVERVWIEDQLLSNHGMCEYDNWDYLISYSSWHNELMKTATNNRCGNYIVLGNPVIKSAAANRLSRQVIEKKKVLYCPTFRNYGNGDVLGIRLVTQAAKEVNFQLVTKLHPLLGGTFLEEHKLDVELIDDIYNAFNDVDIIITDYSSLIFDALSYKGKVILYHYDIDDYVDRVGPLMISTNSIQGAHVAETLDELKQLLLGYDDLEISPDFGMFFQRKFDGCKFMEVINENIQAS